MSKNIKSTISRSVGLKRIGLTLLYTTSYILAYICFLNKHFDYAGFLLYSRNVFFLLFTCFISIIPIVFYRGGKTISSVISIFIYVFIYIPSIITFAVGCNTPVSQIVCIQIVLFTMMCLFFFADRFVLIRNFDNRRFAFIPTRIFLILTIVSTLYVLYIYRGNLQLVSFDNVYEQRFANNIIGTDVFSRYLTSWLTTLFMPICLINGIINKNRNYFIVGCLAGVAMYMATAAKGVILMPVILAGLYFLLSRISIHNIYSYIVLLLSLSIIGLLILFPQPGQIFFYISSLLMWRIVGVGGHLNIWYYDFFLSHPYTYYSHIGPINFLTKAYPYGDLGLGQVVGRHYWTEDMNANANFWATDGFASYGLIGVIIASLVFMFILIFFNTITKKYNKIFLILIFTPFIMSLLNTSLFSTMWSGGGIFLILFLLFNKSEFYSKEHAIN